MAGKIQFKPLNLALLINGIDNNLNLSATLLDEIVL